MSGIADFKGKRHGGDGVVVDGDES